MTLRDRCDAYVRAYAKWPASWPRVVQEQGRDVMLATWVIGNDYRNRSTFYGAYPRGYLERVMALFPDATNGAEILHVFSGSLPKGNYVRCDVLQDAELQCSVYSLPTATAASFRLILADPPYTKSDAEKYGTPSVNRGRAMRALAEVAQDGAHLVWLDTVWPMHSKSQWVTVGRILIQRSTNHRVRVATIFERVTHKAGVEDGSRAGSRDQDPGRPGHEAA